MTKIPPPLVLLTQEIQKAMQEDNKHGKLGMIRDSRYFGISQILISIGILTTIIAAIGYQILMDKTRRAHRRELNNTWRQLADENLGQYDNTGHSPGGGSNRKEIVWQS